MLHQNQKLSVGTLFWYDYFKKKYGKAVPVYNMNAYGGVMVYLHSFLNLALGREKGWVFSITPGPIYLWGKNLPVPTE